MKIFKVVFILIFALTFLGSISIDSHSIPFDRMVLIPGGSFMMGDSTKNDIRSLEVADNRGHRVQIDSFYLDKYEVTNIEYKAFVEAGGYYKKEMWSDDGWQFIRGNNINAPGFWDHPELGFDNPNKPVVGVTFYEAEAYAKWMGKRLPTEAEWEYAARGTDGRKYPWGDQEPDCSRANFFGCSNSTSEVGSLSKGVSPFGIYDLAGNVFEWVNDSYKIDYYLTSPEKNPQGPNEFSLYKVARGGSYLNTEQVMETYQRTRFQLFHWDKNIGFRCARSK